MAARTEERERIDITLPAADAEVADLPGLAADWPSMARLAREAVELEWDDLMDRLGAGVDADRQGGLAPRQRSQYEGMLRLLREHLSLTERLRPPVPQKVLAAMGSGCEGTRG